MALRGSRLPCMKLAAPSSTVTLARSVVGVAASGTLGADVGEAAVGGGTVGGMVVGTFPEIFSLPFSVPLPAPDFTAPCALIG